jgi:PAS domain S-box-containing protein
VREQPGDEVAPPRAGGFRYLFVGNRWEWSDEVARMHGYEPGTVTPTTELVLAHKHPDDRAIVAGLLEQARRRGSPFSSRHRIIDARGHERLVMVVGDLLTDDRGAPAGVEGFYLDVTEQVNADMQAQLSEAIRAVSARRAVINQAMGMLMLRYELDADSAFLLLSRLSQESNVKVRDLAAHIVADTAARRALLDEAADHIDALLDSGPSRPRANRPRAAH